jgi:hypothetical protein
MSNKVNEYNDIFRGTILSGKKMSEGVDDTLKKVLSMLNSLNATLQTESNDKLRNQIVKTLPYYRLVYL